MKISFKIFLSLLFLSSSFVSQAQSTSTAPSATALTTPVVTTTSTTSATPAKTTTVTTPTPVATTTTTPVVTTTTTPVVTATATTTSAPVASVPTATTTPTTPTVVTPVAEPVVTTTNAPSTTVSTQTSVSATPAVTPVTPVSKPKAVVKKTYKPTPVAVVTPTPAPAPVVVAAVTVPEKTATTKSGQKGKRTFGVTGSGYYEINSDYESVYFSFPTSSTNTAGFGVNTYFEYGFSEKVTGEISLGFSRLTYASQQRALISENYFMGDIVAHIYFLDNDKFATYGIAGASVYASSSAIAPMADIGIGNYFKITDNFSIKAELHLKSAIVLNRAEGKVGVAYHF